MYTVHIVHYFIPGTFDGRPYIEKAMAYIILTVVGFKVTFLSHLKISLFSAFFCVSSPYKSLPILLYIISATC